MTLRNVLLSAVAFEAIFALGFGIYWAATRETRNALPMRMARLAEKVLKSDRKTDKTRPLRRAIAIAETVTVVNGL